MPAAVIICYAQQACYFFMCVVIKYIQVKHSPLHFGQFVNKIYEFFLPDPADHIIIYIGMVILYSNGMIWLVRFFTEVITDLVDCYPAEPSFKRSLERILVQLGEYPVKTVVQDFLGMFWNGHVAAYYPIYKRGICVVEFFLGLPVLCNTVPDQHMQVRMGRFFACIGISIQIMSFSGQTENDQVLLLSWRTMLPKC